MREILQAEPYGHPDVHIVQPKSKSRQIVVEDIDEMILKLNQTTYHAHGYRFGLILQADRMNATAANKFLKTLEEPHSRTHIFLVTEHPSHLLPTVRSRCGLINVKCPPPTPDNDTQPLLTALREHKLRDPLDSLLWAREVEKYLHNMKKNCETQLLELSRGELNMLEAAAREEKEQEILAAASALYSERRATLFSHFITTLAESSVDAARFVEDAHSHLLKNLQDAVVLENLALKISAKLNQDTPVSNNGT